MLLAGNGVMTGTMTIGDLVLVDAFLIQLYMPLHFLGFVYRESAIRSPTWSACSACSGRHTEVEDKPAAPGLVVRTGHIRFEHASFHYDANRPILFGVDFEIPAGHKVAVVGASGAGKSTLARLLFRFYDVSAGRILIDGQDIREVTQLSLRSRPSASCRRTRCCLTTAFTTTSSTAGRTPAAKKSIAAAKAAHIHDFVESLPDKYDSLVGERGLNSPAAKSSASPSPARC